MTYTIGGWKLNKLLHFFMLIILMCLSVILKIIMVFVLSECMFALDKKQISFGEITFILFSYRI